jgi:hypothetical protein
MPKKISPLECREWKRRLETGESLQVIAKKTRHALRVVQRAVEWAQIEEQSTIIREENLRTAARKHQEDLGQALDDVIQDLEVPPLNLDLGTASVIGQTELRKGSYFPVAGGEGKIRFLNEGNPDNPRFTFLQQHLAQQTAWSYIQTWRRRAVIHLDQRVRLFEEVIDQVNRLKLPVDENLAEKGVTYLSPAVPRLVYLAALGRILDDSVGFDFNKDSTARPDRFLRLREQKIGFVKGKGYGMIREKILSIASASGKDTLAEELRVSYHGLKAAAVKAREETVKIKYAYLVPGRCEACKRYGL